MKIIRKSAFTLVELMFIIIVITILATLAFLYLQEYSSEARDSKRKDYLAKLKTSIEAYYIKNDKYPDPDNEVVPSSLKGRREGEIGQGIITQLRDISYEKDFRKDTKYKYFIVKTGDAFKLQTLLETGEKVEFTNTDEKQIYVNEETGYIFKYSGKRWPKEDGNCRLKDIEVWSSSGELLQVWAGCNSTLGKGLEWGDGDYLTPGAVEKCYDYNYTWLSSEESLHSVETKGYCDIGDPAMISYANPKEYFNRCRAADGKNKFGDKEIHSIWGKFYNPYQASGACPDGWHVSSVEDFRNLFKYIGVENADSLEFYPAKSAWGEVGKGHGWREHSSKKIQYNLVNLLRINLGGYKNSNGFKYTDRGATSYLWIFKNKDNKYLDPSTKILNTSNISFGPSYYGFFLEETRLGSGGRRVCEDENDESTCSYKGLKERSGVFVRCVKDL